MLRDLVRRRPSEREASDPREPLSEQDVEAILDSARWAPAAHDMQHLDIVVVDRRETLRAIARVDAVPTVSLVKENAAQLSWREEELMARGTGLLGTMFPPSWWPDGGRPARRELGVEHATGATEGADGTGGVADAPRAPRGVLGEVVWDSPMVLVVLYDPSVRAQASDGDFLGIVSLGCVLENMWLTATSLGIGMQMMSMSGGPDVERDVRALLGVPHRLRIAFACRLGYADAVLASPRRGRRPHEHSVHWNRYQRAEADAT